MNRKIIFPLIGLVSATAISATLLAAAPKTGEFSVLADNPTLDITGDMLNATVLEDFAMPDNREATTVWKNDKKFKIDLGNDRYLLGAMLFGDCDDQFIGSTLGDGFGLNNLENSKENAVNFHLVLSFQNVTKVTVDYHITLEQKAGVSNNAVDKPMLAVKVKSLDAKPTSDEAFYNLLTNDGYKGLLDNEQNSYYNEVRNGNPGNDQLSPGTTRVGSQTRSSFNNAVNLCVLRFTNEAKDLIDANRKVTFTIKHLFFDYSCN